MLIGFKKQFAHLVESGEKTQTVRSFPKRVPRIGETAYLYTGLRTKGCRKLGEAIIEGISVVMINWHSMKLAHFCQDKSQPLAGTGFDIERFAVLDGFSCWKEMRDWFEATHGLPFEGLLIKWTDFRRAE